MDEATSQPTDKPTAHRPTRKLDVRFLRYLGPGFLVTVGFIDPGNWATNVGAGAEFNYRLLWVITLSTLMLILLQHMSAHLGIVTGRCLSEACREYLPRPWAWVIGSTAILACIATALAEICGAAIGLRILFNVPLIVGAVIAAVVISALIWSQKYNRLEHIVIGFVSIIGFCYVIQLLIVRPEWQPAIRGTFVPSVDSSSILLAMGMLGAVVMPHNMFLHSEIIQSRNWKAKGDKEKRRLLRYEMLDTIVSMGAGWLINSAMIIVAAAVFFRAGVVVTKLEQAAATLEPLAGHASSLLFSLALLFAGVSSSLTAGLAGGTVFTGFAGKPTALQSRWFRLGMLLTLIPAVAIIALPLDTFKMLILSQVCLSIQLPFTVVALTVLTSSKRVMGEFANRWPEKTLLIITAAIVIGLNLLLLYQTFGGTF